MSIPVEVTYITRALPSEGGDIIGVHVEKNLLLEIEDEVGVPGTPIEIDIRDLIEPGFYLLEDQEGLWRLPYEDCLSIKYL